MVESLEQFKFKINDCHIHIGNSSSINKTFEPTGLIKHPADKVLLMSAQEDIDKNNRLVKLLTEHFPDIYGLYWLDKTNWVYPQIDGKMVGFKYHGAYTGYPVTNSSYVIGMEYLNSKSALLMVHCGRYKEGARSSNTSYHHALDIATTYPNIKVIMAHMGGTDTTICKKAVKDSSDYNNVYFDTSGITTPYIIEYAVDHLGSKRILFGSDAPWCSFNAMYHTVLDAAIPEDDKKNIFTDNFETLIARCRSIPAV